MKDVYFDYIRFGSNARIELEGNIKNILLKKYNFLCRVSYKSLCLRLGWEKFENGFVLPKFIKSLIHSHTCIRVFLRVRYHAWHWDRKKMCILKTKLDLWMQKWRDWSFLIIFIILFVSKVFKTERLFTSIFQKFPDCPF